MHEVVLTIQSPAGADRLPMTGDRLTIGRGDSVDLSISDPGLSRLHLSVHRQGDNIWVIDEDSTNGSQVNGLPIPASGAALSDGDKISIGDSTTLWVAITGSDAESAAARGTGLASISFLPLAAGILLALMVLVGGGVLAARIFRDAPANRNSDRNKGVTAADGRGENGDSGSVDSEDVSLRNPSNSNSGSGAIVREAPLPENSNSSTSLNSQGGGTGPQARQDRKLYLQMTPEERNEFIYRRARDISKMMSNREYVFTDDVLPYIKKYVDGYAGRVDNNSQRFWGEDLNYVFVRAKGYAPDIIRAFNQYGVRPIVGLYIVMIETEYHNIPSENFAGAAGLFQFIGPTARGYGVDPSARTDVKKMAPAAAHYMSDRVIEFGNDPMSVALAIAGYNRSTTSVMRDLHDVASKGERSFWTLVANSEKLDHFFQNENIKYVPKFFAAAIVGETPWAFGLQMQRPLSTYAEGADK
jgi:hypothetical protein